MSTDRDKFAEPYERTPLPPGKYGDKEKHGLEIAQYVGIKETKKDGTNKYTFRVEATNGAEGSAWLNLFMPSWFLTPEAASLAFNKRKALSGTTQEQVDRFEAGILARLRDQVETNNVPEEAQAESIKNLYNKLLKEISIKVGVIYRLQKRRGLEKDETADLSEIEGATFSATVKDTQYGPTVEPLDVLLER